MLKRYLVCGLVCVLVLSLLTVQSARAQVSDTPIKKAALIYGYDWDDEATSYFAVNFNLLVVDFNGSRNDFHIPYAEWMTDLRSKSSSIQIFGYKDFQYSATYNDDWAEVNTHEDWFVHDDDANRIMNPRWGTYLMDIGNSGWRQHWLSYVNNKLGNCSAYNGVFADDVSDTLYPEAFDHAPNATRISSWHDDVLGMLQYAKTNLLPGAQLLINTEAGWAPGHINYDYLDVVDGMLIEGYFHASWENSSSYSKVFESQLTCLASGLSNGKIMIAGSGSTTEDNRILEWTYATFLLGVNGSTAYWSWNIGSSYTRDPEYHSITETNIGSPIGSYYQSQSIYMRNFTGGRVLSNPSENPAIIDLGSSFWFLNNTEVSNLTIDGYSGEILLNAPLPTSTITDSPPVFPPPSFPRYSPPPSPTPPQNSTPTLRPTVNPNSTNTTTPSSPNSSSTSPPEHTNDSSFMMNLAYATASGAVIAIVCVVIVCVVIIRKDLRQWLAKSRLSKKLGKT